jgi:hypothetical protein
MGLPSRKRPRNHIDRRGLGKRSDTGKVGRRAGSARAPDGFDSLAFRKETGCVSQNKVAFDRGCGRRSPAAGDACFQKFLGIGPMVPDGDRRHDAKSGAVVNQPQAAGVSHDKVMAVLVLCENILRPQRRLMAGQPIDGSLDRTMPGNLHGKPFKGARREPGTVLDWKGWSHDPLRRGQARAPRNTSLATKRHKNAQKRESRQIIPPSCPFRGRVSLSFFFVPFCAFLWLFPARWPVLAFFLHRGLGRCVRVAEAGSTPCS